MLALKSKVLFAADLAEDGSTRGAPGPTAEDRSEVGGGGVRGAVGDARGVGVGGAGVGGVSYLVLGLLLHPRGREDGDDGNLRLRRRTCSCRSSTAKRCDAKERPG